MEKTIFKKIIDKEIPAEIVYEDDDVLAFNDIDPQAPIHVLIIPKREIRTLNDLTPEDSDILGKLFMTAKKIAKDKGIEKEGYRFVFNCNEKAGQTVFHVHGHLLGGRKLNWPPG